MAGSITNLSETGVMLLCLDGFLKHDWNGRLYTRYSAGPLYFCGTLTLLKIIEQFCDQTNFPRAALEFRSFFPYSDRKKIAEEREKTKADTADRRSTETAAPSEKELRQNRGELATLLMRIQYRQQATLQGQLYWVEQNKRAEFCSVMEFLKLIDNMSADPARQSGVPALHSSPAYRCVWC